MSNEGCVWQRHERECMPGMRTQPGISSEHQLGISSEHQLSTSSPTPASKAPGTQAAGTGHWSISFRLSFQGNRNVPNTEGQNAFRNAFRTPYLSTCNRLYDRIALRTYFIHVVRLQTPSTPPSMMPRAEVRRGQRSFYTSAIQGQGARGSQRSRG